MAKTRNLLPQPALLPGKLLSSCHTVQLQLRDKLALRSHMSPALWPKARLPEMTGSLDPRREQLERLHPTCWQGLAMDTAQVTAERVPVLCLCPNPPQPLPPQLELGDFCQLHQWRSAAGVRGGPGGHTAEQRQELGVKHCPPVLRCSRLPCDALTWRQAELCTRKH